MLEIKLDINHHTLRYERLNKLPLKKFLMDRMNHMEGCELT